MIILLAGAWGPGCIVTDKIRFDDAVNHQISIERDQPSDSITTVILNEEKQFSVTVRDEDVTDIADGDVIQGLLEIDAFNWSETRFLAGDCTPPTRSLLLDPLDTDVDEVPTFTIECRIFWKGLSDVSAGDILTVRLVVSDLGFIHYQPREGATTAEVLWTVQVGEVAP